MYKSGWLREYRIRPHGNILCTKEILAKFLVQETCREAGKNKGQGYFAFWGPTGTQFLSLVKAKGAGYKDDDDIEKILVGKAAEELKKERKKVMYKEKAVPRLP